MKGQAMTEQRHYATNDLQMKVKLLQNNFSHLKELVEIRGDRLKDAVQSLQVKPLLGVEVPYCFSPSIVLTKCKSKLT
jgi:hypothetical protein